MALTELKTVGITTITTPGRNSGDPANVPGPVNIAYADKNRWLRVLVRNLSNGAEIDLALSSQEGRQTPASDAIFKLPAGTSEVIPLAPGQKLYGSTSGNNVLASVCISDALPVDVDVPRK